MGTYRYAATTFEAYQFHGKREDCQAFIGPNAKFHDGDLWITTVNGGIENVPYGSWVIKTATGFFFHRTPDYFEDNYEEVRHPPKGTAR